MFELQQPLTNQRPKDERAILTLSPTEGVIKISNSVANALGLKADDYVTVIPAKVKDEQGNVVTRNFLTKGVAPITKEDAEDGKEVKQVGAKLAFSNGSIQFSSKNVYKTLGGDTEFNTVFTAHIGENGQGEPVVMNDKTYIMLTFLEKKPKTVRTASEDKNEAGAAVIDDEEYA